MDLVKKETIYRIIRTVENRLNSSILFVFPKTLGGFFKLVLLPAVSHLANSFALLPDHSQQAEKERKGNHPETLRKAFK